MATIDASGLSPDEGDVFSGDDTGVAVYRRKDGTFKVMSAICPHAHCEVAWNSSGKEWDCPCHGSRFSAEGKVIEGPAQENLSGLRVNEHEGRIEA